MSQVKLSRKHQIVIPKEARQEMQVKAGDHLIVESLHGITIILPRPKIIGRHLKGLAKGIYSSRYLGKERRSWTP